MEQAKKETKIFGLTFKQNERFKRKSKFIKIMYERNVNPVTCYRYIHFGSNTASVSSHCLMKAPVTRLYTFFFFFLRRNRSCCRSRRTAAKSKIENLFTSNLNWWSKSVCIGFWSSIGQHCIVSVCFCYHSVGVYVHHR